MMNFSDIPARLHALYDDRHEPERVHLLADMYWRTLIALAALTVLFAVYWGVWDLFDVFDILSSAADTSPLPPPALNHKALDTLVQSFDARQAHYQAFSSQLPPAIPDPSK
jgi:hypothetical protein